MTGLDRAGRFLGPKFRVQGSELLVAAIYLKWVQFLPWIILDLVGFTLLGKLGLKLDEGRGLSTDLHRYHRLRPSLASPRGDGV